MDRRLFIENALWLSSGALTLLTSCHAGPTGVSEPDSNGGGGPNPGREQREKAFPIRRSRVALVRTADRQSGVRRALDMLAFEDFSGKDVFLKPNFNSADPTPGSTHIDTLAALVGELQGRGAARITMGDRSGMGNTRSVMKKKGVFDFGESSGIDTIVFDELEADDWELITQPGHHWRRGFAMPKVVLTSDAYVQTCCLKTHGFGGHFTMALKNTVGLVAKHVPGGEHNYMTELHASANQRLMIAEANTAVRPSLIVVDGLKAFVRGGPAQGKLESPGVILAGTDPVAIDAVAVAVLRQYDTTSRVASGPIFELEQIARAAELGLGARGPGEIEIVSDDAVGREYAAVLERTLAA